MLATLLAQLVITIVVLLVVVPAATDNGVKVLNGGFFSALWTLLVVGLLNTGLWAFVGVSTLGVAVLANILLFGLIGLAINGTAFWLASVLMPNTLQVRSFGSACFASLIMTVTSILVHHLVIL